MCKMAEMAEHHAILGHSYHRNKLRTELVVELSENHLAMYMFGCCSEEARMEYGMCELYFKTKMHMNGVLNYHMGPFSLQRRGESNMASS